MKGKTTRRLVSKTLDKSFRCCITTLQYKGEMLKCNSATNLNNTPATETSQKRETPIFFLKLHQAEKIFPKKEYENKVTENIFF
jgi:hypothetical protein